MGKLSKRSIRSRKGWITKWKRDIRNIELFEKDYGEEFVEENREQSDVIPNLTKEELKKKVEKEREKIKNLKNRDLEKELKEVNSE